MTVKVPSMPNPGCRIPDIPAVPDVSQYLTVKLPTDALAKLIPTLEVTKLLALAATIQEEVEAFELAVKKRARNLQRLLEIPCPLPNIPISELTSDVEGLFSKLDVAGGQETSGESIYISPGEDF